MADTTTEQAPTKDAARVIETTPVESSSLAEYGYGDGTLAVKFPNGHIYHYPGVPERLWREFQMIQSKGQFYAREIRGRFTGEKMTGTCAGCKDVGALNATCTDCGTGYYR